ncbi:MAG: hypothetical protein AAGI30_06490 [Planctomycetota bacterium]
MNRLGRLILALVLTAFGGVAAALDAAPRPSEAVSHAHVVPATDHQVLADAFHAAVLFDALGTHARAVDVDADGLITREDALRILAAVRGVSDRSTIAPGSGLPIPDQPIVAAAPASVPASSRSTSNATAATLTDRTTVAAQCQGGVAREESSAHRSVTLTGRTVRGPPLA